MNDVVTSVLEAATTRNWDEVKLLLHPYLHWSDHDDVTLRGPYERAALARRQADAARASGTCRAAQWPDLPLDIVAWRQYYT